MDIISAAAQSGQGYPPMGELFQCFVINSNNLLIKGGPPGFGGGYPPYGGPPGGGAPPQSPDDAWQVGFLIRQE